MIILEVRAVAGSVIEIVTDKGVKGRFDVTPYLDYPAFETLRNTTEFSRVKSGGYYIEWKCGADLSADTIEARMVVIE